MPTQGPEAPIPNVQYFWEAFPSGSGSSDRTTYLFTYIDADPSRFILIYSPSLHCSGIECLWLLVCLRVKTYRHTAVHLVSGVCVVHKANGYTYLHKLVACSFLHHMPALRAWAACK